MRKNICLMVGLLLGVWIQSATAGDDPQSIHIQGAWVREAPPVAEVLAAYLSIENSGPLLRVLTGATSLSFERVEIHKSMVHNGMVHMQKQEKVEIPPQDRVVFNPGGYHFMLTGRKGSLPAGSQVELTLFFQNGEKKLVVAEVRKSASAGGQQQMDHSQHGMVH